MDPLGTMAARCARGPISRRARAPAGRRISAEELRARGVDEDFLKPAKSVTALIQRDEQEHILEKNGASASSSTAGLQASTSRERSPTSPCTNRVGNMHFISGGEALPQNSRAAVGTHGTHESTCEASRETSAGKVAAAAKRERRWSADELGAEYGVGYKLMVAMGYQGGGATPLAPQKRQNRIGLQDDEKLAMDPHCPRPRKRIARQRTNHERGQTCDTGIAADMAWGALNDAENDEDDAENELSGSSENDEDACDCSPLDIPLRRAVLRELRQVANGRLSFEVLAKRPRVRQVLLDRLDIKSSSCLIAFIKSTIPECRISHSAAPGWRKLSGNKSMASWFETAKRERVVTLRQRKGAALGDTSGWNSSQSSSSDAEKDRNSEDGDNMFSAQNSDIRPTRSAAVVGALAPSWSCHSCRRSFSNRAMLRTHLVEQMMANTTHDPTDLGFRFDPEHQDRLALQAVVDHTVAPVVKVLGNSPDSLSVAWRCPACGWRSAGTEQSSSLCVAQLLDHACEAPGQRIAHDRLLMLICDLLIEETPTRLASSQKDGPFHDWAAGVSRLARLFHMLANRGGEDSELQAAYSKLEESTLGPLEEDIFSV